MVLCNNISNLAKTKDLTSFLLNFKIVFLNYLLV